MSTKSLIFGVLLLVWSGGSGYWYMCKIKHYCDKNYQQTQVNTLNQTAQSIELDNTKQPDVALLKADSAETVPKVENVTKITLSSKSAVYYFPFAKYSYELTDIDKLYFAELKTYLNANTNAILEINGYADTKGSAEANLRYSKLRAEYIVKLLRNEGIEAQRIRMQYFGDEKAINTAAYEEANARLSRRVELFVKP